MLDISSRADLPDKAVLYLDGPDARVYKSLIKKLGSEDRVRNAMILSGFLATSREHKKITKEKSKEIKASFSELVGVSFSEFERLLDNI